MITNSDVRTEFEHELIACLGRCRSKGYISLKNQEEYRRLILESFDRAKDVSKEADQLFHKACSFLNKNNKVGVAILKKLSLKENQELTALQIYDRITADKGKYFTTPGTVATTIQYLRKKKLICSDTGRYEISIPE